MVRFVCFLFAASTLTWSQESSRDLGRESPRDRTRRLLEHVPRAPVTRTNTVTKAVATLHSLSKRGDAPDAPAASIVLHLPAWPAWEMEEWEVPPPQKAIFGVDPAAEAYYRRRNELYAQMWPPVVTPAGNRASGMIRAITNAMAGTISVDPRGVLHFHAIGEPPNPAPLRIANTPAAQDVRDALQFQRRGSRSFHQYPLQMALDLVGTPCAMGGCETRAPLHLVRAPGVQDADICVWLEGSTLEDELVALCQAGNLECTISANGVIWVAPPDAPPYRALDLPPDVRRRLERVVIPFFSNHEDEFGEVLKDIALAYGRHRPGGRSAGPDVFEDLEMPADTEALPLVTVREEDISCFLALEILANLTQTTVAQEGGRLVVRPRARAQDRK